jgi:nitrate reductase molybdenum cofactor assembly chaperone NarJ/NarW
MRSLKAIAALLSYPTAELQQAADEIGRVIAAEAAIRSRVRRQFDALIDDIAIGDLYDLQERYVLLFDRTRSLSLHLFEHVHGESRDRGQAMIDLKAQYEASGLVMSTTELPDFIPLFLEYLSMRPATEAHELLGQPAHIFAALAERLRKRQSPYEAAFRVLVALASGKPKDDEVAALLNEPDADANDFAALDAAWEDEPVTFGPGAGDSCKDKLITRVRAGRRPAPGVESPTHRPILPRH